MERNGSVRLILFVATVLITQSTAIKMVKAGDMPGADAANLWEFITKTEPYTKWEFWPGREEMYKGTFHPSGFPDIIKGDDYRREIIFKSCLNKYHRRKI